MHVTLVICALTEAGGAERVVSLMVNCWAQKKDWCVTVATFDDGEQPPFYTLPSGVKHQPLSIAQHSSKLVKSVSDTKRKINVLQRSSIVQRASQFIGCILNTRRRAEVVRQYFEATSPDVVISFVTETNVVSLRAAGGEL